MPVDDINNWPLIKDDLVYLEENLQKRRNQISDSATKKKRNFVRIQWGVVMGGVVLVGLNAAQAALDDASTVLTVLTASISFILGVIVLVGQELKLQKRWIKQRAAAEAMKHEQYFYLARVGEYGKTDRPKQLLEERLIAIEEELDEDE